MEETNSKKKRSSRACDGCKNKRMRCEDVHESKDGQSSCKLCRELSQECTFQLPVRKRGPAPGFRRRSSQPHSPAHADISKNGEGSNKALGSGTTGRALSAAGDDDQSNRTSRTASPPVGEPSTSNIRPRRAAPFFGLPPQIVDRLLAVYFTHIHNVWPLIYKPLFNPHTTSSPLLLAMLAIAACTAPLSGQDGIDGERLFYMAEKSLHHCRNESRIDIIQSLILLSLRQTGCGDKRSAFAYSGRACCMALNLGLNMASSSKAGGETTADDEVRARVYWNCYILDKTLAEETGRSFLLSYRRTTTRLPSTTETDELETWPPLPTSSSPLPNSVQHIIPRRGYIMSGFVWGCRLAMMVEDILDLDLQGPASTDPWDVQFAAKMQEKHDVFAEAERISNQMDLWRSSLPAHLDPTSNPDISPMPHHVVSLAWLATSKILLYSRFIKGRLANPTQSHSLPPLGTTAHALCSEAAQTAIDLFALLDRHKLLNQISSDIIHILSLITLFEAYDSTDTNESLAHRAKINFAQCCIWLRDFSSSWPAASAHKLFFEGLIQGGLKLSSPEDELNNGAATNTSPHVVMGSPPIPEGLQAMGRNLSTVTSAPDPAKTPTLPTVRPSPGPSSLFQLPQYYWNHLTNANAQPNQQEPNSTDFFDFSFASPDHNSAPTNTSWDISTMNPAQSTLTEPLVVDSSFWPSNSETAQPDVPIPTTTPAAMDQAAIYSALMSYMMEAAKVR